MFYQDLFHCVSAWFRSRRWWYMALLAFLPLSMVLFFCSLVVYGATLSRQSLAARYLELIQDDLDAGSQALPDAGLTEEVTGGVAGVAAVPGNGSEHAAGSNDVDAQRDAQRDARRVQVPMRRILQLGNFNPRVVFAVASQMTRQGRLGIAARMMRDIAPLDSEEGFAQAHAWLAHYVILNWKGTEAQAETLLADLQAAERGGVTLTSGQVQHYASLLLKQQRNQDALAVLRDYAAQYPELNVLLASLSKQMGLTGVQYQSALTAGRESFEAKRKAGDLQPQDWIQAVQVEMLDGALDRALALARAGFESDPQAAELRRLYSDVLLAKHHSLHTEGQPLIDSAPQGSASDDSGPAKLPELRYLDAACEVDSANPALASELAKAMADGLRLTPQMKSVLQASLVDGTASGITHLILANSFLTSETPEAALPHLRLAARKMPNSPVVMNNFAYVLMKYEPSKLDEAQEMMERALSIPGGSVKDRASMFDTLGEIRLTQGETLAAIEMFEQAIELDGSKLVTREHLVEAYRQAGMSELAEAQQRRIAELSTQKE